MPLAIELFQLEDCFEKLIKNQQEATEWAKGVLSRQTVISDRTDSECNSGFVSLPDGSQHTVSESPSCGRSLSLVRHSD